MGNNSGIVGKPSQSEKEQYSSKVRSNPDLVAAILYHYLYLGDNMEDTQKELTGATETFSISLITRCNGFYIEGNKSLESGRYRTKNTRETTQHKPLMDKNGNQVKFVSKKDTLQLTYEDFLDFVYAHPQGENDYRIMDYFMLERDKKNRGIPEYENICETEDESFTPWNNGNSHVTNQFNNDESKWTGESKQNDNYLIGRIIAAIILVLIVLAILSKLGIGIVELGLIAGIIYLIVRKIKSPKKIKQSKPKSSSSSYYSAAQKSVNKQYGSAANKRNSPFVFKPSKGGVALLVIMCLWAMSGYANGGSPIICLIMVIIGLSGVIKKK